MVAYPGCHLRHIVIPLSVATGKKNTISFGPHTCESLLSETKLQVRQSEVSFRAFLIKFLFFTWIWRPVIITQRYVNFTENFSFFLDCGQSEFLFHYHVLSFDLSKACFGLPNNFECPSEDQIVSVTGVWFILMIVSHATKNLRSATQVSDT